jgi:radical SAM protein with 4Fe4S-binding SPASM domain
MPKQNTQDLVEFIKLASEQATEINWICFHGGEPFLFVKQMDRILEEISPYIEKMGARVNITTNGSLIAENADFMTKWGHLLFITLSYDFQYQTINREAIDLDTMAQVLVASGAHRQVQFVCPPDGFNIDTVYHVVKDMKKMRCNTINLVPLRHLRGEQKFKVLIDEIDLDRYAVEFMRFIHTLYAQGLTVCIDGNYASVDKAYLNGHVKLILSPDGYIYPEFDFLEYRRNEFRIGKWKDSIEINRYGDEDSLLREGCVNCEMRDACGLKYLYKMFDHEPTGACKKFYSIVDLAVKHTWKLKQKKSMLHWIGADEKL